jgi:hypothetical protein
MVRRILILALAATLMAPVPLAAQEGDAPAADGAQAPQPKARSQERPKNVGCGRRAEAARHGRGVAERGHRAADVGSVVPRHGVRLKPAPGQVRGLGAALPQGYGRSAPVAGSPQVGEHSQASGLPRVGRLPRDLEQSPSRVGGALVPGGGLFGEHASEPEVQALGHFDRRS